MSQPSSPTVHPPRLACLRVELHLQDFDGRQVGAVAFFGERAKVAADAGDQFVAGQERVGRVIARPGLDVVGHSPILPLDRLKPWPLPSEAR